MIYTILGYLSNLDIVHLDMGIRHYHLLRDGDQDIIIYLEMGIRTRILVQVTIYRRLLIGQDGHLDQSEAYDIS